jgi:hypothetical protein
VIPFRHVCATCALGVMLLYGCGTPHGQPLKGSETLAPNQILDFDTLYAENCAGCHGGEARPSRLPLPSIFLSRTTQRFAKLSPAACAEPPCRPSL